MVLAEFETLCRVKNLTFYLTLADYYTIKEASLRSGLAQQHAFRLLNKWKKVGWIVRKDSLHGARYFYTVKGENVRVLFTELEPLLIRTPKKL